MVTILSLVEIELYVFIYRTQFDFWILANMAKSIRFEPSLGVQPIR